MAPPWPDPPPRTSRGKCAHFLPTHSASAFLRCAQRRVVPIACRFYQPKGDIFPPMSHNSEFSIQLVSLAPLEREQSNVDNNTILIFHLYSFPRTTTSSVYIMPWGLLSSFPFPGGTLGGRASDSGLDESDSRLDELTHSCANAHKRFFRG
jgi:hypothetical protein